MLLWNITSVPFGCFLKLDPDRTTNWAFIVRRFFSRYHIFFYKMIIQPSFCTPWWGVPHCVSTFQQLHTLSAIHFSKWSQTADDIHPRSTCLLLGLSDQSPPNGRAAACCRQKLPWFFFTKNLLKSSSCTFGTKSELAVARAKVSALSGAARGKEFQLGEESCSDGWMILSSVCNSSPSMPSPVPVRIKECVRPPSQLQIYSKSIPGWDFIVIHNDLWSLWQVSVLAGVQSHTADEEKTGEQRTVTSQHWRRRRKKKVIRIALSFPWISQLIIFLRVEALLHCSPRL